MAVIAEEDIRAVATVAFVSESCTPTLMRGLVQQS
jgi:hypothetical protein